MSKDYYKILEVSKSASQDDIKRAFRKLAHKYHPDKKDGDEQKFKDVNEAYQVLGDAQKRKTYDQFGSAAFQNGGPGAGGFGGFGGAQGFQGMNFDFSNMGDMGDVFGSMFGFGGRGRKQNRGRDIQVDVTLDFLEAVHGCEKEVQLYSPTACGACDGTGAKDKELEACSACDGKGQTTTAQRTILGTIQMQTPCAECQGTGEKPKTPCSSCGGDGVKREERTVKVEIPAGVDSDNIVTLRGQGESAGRGSTPGDLHVRLRIKAHPEFRRDEQDIHSTARVPFSTLVLGGSVDVATVDGEGSLKIPAGTDGGTVFKLRGKGVPYLKGNRRGDQFVTVQPIVNKAPNRKAKKLVEELRDEGM